MDVYTMLDNLVPLVHQTMWELHRVPMRKLGKERAYLMHVKEGVNRIWTDETMPDFIKTKLTMILASQVKEPIPDDELDRIELYINHDNPELSEVGWRASESMFIIVMTDEELRSLWGEQINKEK